MIMVILGVVFFAIGALFFWIGNLFGGQDFAGGAASGGGIGMDIGGIAFFIGGLVFIGIGVATRRSAANRKRIEATGVAGQATITDIGETNMMVNERPVLNLSLTVTIPGQAPYPIQQRMVMPWNAMGRMVVGATVPVMVDPANPSEVVIEWSGQSAARATAGGMAGGISPHIPQPNTLSTMGPTVAAPNQLGAAPGVNVVQLGSQVGGTGTASGEALLAYLRTMGVNISGPVASMVVNAANAHNARIFSMSGQMMPGGMMMAGATPTPGLLPTIPGVPPAAAAPNVTMDVGSAAESLKKNGVAGRAVIKTADDLAVASEGKRLMRLELEVTPDGQSPYTVQHVEMVPEASVGRISPGASVAVHVDPTNQQNLEIDWDGA